MTINVANQFLSVYSSFIESIGEYRFYYATLSICVLTLYFIFIYFFFKKKEELVSEQKRSKYKAKWKKKSKPSDAENVECSQFKDALKPVPNVANQNSEVSIPVRAKQDVQVTSPVVSKKQKLDQRSESVNFGNWVEVVGRRDKRKTKQTDIITLGEVETVSKKLVIPVALNSNQSSVVEETKIEKNIVNSSGKTAKTTILSSEISSVSDVKTTDKKHKNKSITSVTIIQEVSPPSVGSSKSRVASVPTITSTPLSKTNETKTLNKEHSLIKASVLPSINTDSPSGNKKHTNKKSEKINCEATEVSVSSKIMKPNPTILATLEADELHENGGSSLVKKKKKKKATSGRGNLQPGDTTDPLNGIENHGDSIGIKEKPLSVKISIAYNDTSSAVIENGNAGSSMDAVKQHSNSGYDDWVEPSGVTKKKRRVRKDV